MKDTVSQEFFDEKYRQKSDPWDFASSEYEQSRYQAVFDALHYRRFARAFEPGCSIGILTERLAAICDRVVAVDISPTAVDSARERCKTLSNVEITCGALPDLPAGDFDLVVMSEIGYYFDERQLTLLAEKLAGKIRKPGVLLAAHWLGYSEDHLLSGDRVHEIFGALADLTVGHSERHAAFRLDRWETK